VVQIDDERLAWLKIMKIREPNCIMCGDNPPQSGTVVEVVLSGPTAADLEVRRLKGRIECEVESLRAERDLARAERDLLLFLMRREDGRPAPTSIEQAEARVAEVRKRLERLKDQRL
jgi:hypothetical protein